jgi:SAM-dependent methyltransferase
MQVTEAVLDSVKGSGPRSVLSVGSGPQELKEWEDNGFVVVRCDIDPNTSPDIVRDMTKLGNIGLFDVVFCCHALEHLYPHQLYYAITEFYRVLRPGGHVIILVPDLEDVKPTEDVLHRSDCGPISGLHLYYGDPNEIPHNPYMAHHCGFVANGLKKVIECGGFEDVYTSRLPNYNLMGVGIKK